MPKHRHPSSSYARILFRHLRLSEENSAAYFEGTNVSFKELMSLDGPISHDDLVQIYRNVLTISDIKGLGLSVGTQLHMSTHGPLGVATFSGPDLRTGLHLLARYGQTREEFFKITISDHPQGLKIIFTESFDLDNLREFLSESVLSGIFSAITFFADGDQFKGQVNFTYPKPSYWQKYSSHFGDKVQFNQPNTEIIVPESILSIPSLVSDPVLHKEAIVICDRQLKEINVGEAGLPPRSTEQAVSKLLRENPGVIWNLNEVADKLHMSSRTLIRKLEAEGTKFQIIRDEIAKKQAINYMTDTSFTVESIGHLMGFSDVSSFRRSFKRWFGETPSQYIARVRGGSN
jgi:AraC-like DNA-binding protein